MSIEKLRELETQKTEILKFYEFLSFSMFSWIWDIKDRLVKSSLREVRFNPRKERLSCEARSSHQSDYSLLDIYTLCREMKI